MTAPDAAARAPDLTPILVVNIRHGEPYDLYIGRPVPRKRLGGSRWANPFRVEQWGLTESLRRCEEHIRDDVRLVGALAELDGKRLGCWCAPKGGCSVDDPLVCHGQVLARLRREQRDGD